MSSRNSDRNLLFGILALQMDFINREALIKAMSGWAVDKQKSLGEILVANDALLQRNRELLEQMVSSHIQMHHGDPEKSLAALNSAGSLREDLAKVDDADIQNSIQHVLNATPSAGNADDTISHVTDEQTIQASRFRIIRPHAEGGLGRVSVAIDRELNREVALKEIKQAYVESESARTRFIFEAEVTGGLEHPGIVPVYGLGHRNDGQPYYAMRFIQGDSLKEACKRFHEGKSVRSETENSLDFRKLLGRFIDVCQAIEYAHSRGVLHRDLKPGNIMLGKYGETLVVDWGLAKSVGRDEAHQNIDERTLQPNSSGSSPATQIGTTLGTPNYMSPEQAAGKLDLLGPSSDVYSLGATLYYLLTGRPPFIGKDLGEVIRSVQSGDFPRPVAVLPTVPKPLDAICSRAMSLNGADRYPTARELAADIERYLADEPVSSFKEPIPTKMRRWARQHPGIVASLAASLVVGLSCAIAIAIIVSNSNRKLADANGKLQVLAKAEEKARAAAESNEAIVRQQSDLALSTLTSVIDDIQTGLHEVPGGGEVRRRLLGTSLTKLDQLATEYVSKLSVDKRSMMAMIEMGDVIRRFGVDPSLKQADTTSKEPSTPSALSMAKTLYDRAHQIGEKLLQEPTHDAQDRRNMTVVLDRLAAVSRDGGDLDKALQYYQSSYDVRSKLAEDNPDQSQAKQDLALSCEKIGDTAMLMGDVDQGLQAYQQAFQLNEQLLAAQPEDKTVRRAIGIAYDNLGYGHLKAGQLDRAVESYAQAVDVRERLLSEHPGESQLIRDLMITCNNLGDLSFQQEKLVESRDFHRRALDLAERLAAADPNDRVVQRDLLLSLMKLGGMHLQLDEIKEARRCFERQSVIAQNIAEQDEHNVEAQRDLAISYSTLGDIGLKSDDFDYAIRHYERANSIQQAILKADGDAAQIRRDQFITRYKIGSAHFGEQKWGTAAREYRRSAEILSTMIELDQFVDFASKARADMERLAKTAEAMPVALGDWDSLMTESAERLPELLDLRGVTFAEEGRFTEAVAAADRLLELADVNPTYLYNAACILAQAATSDGATDAHEPTENQKTNRQARIDRALKALRRAIEMGWNDHQHTRDDPLLKILKDLPEFQELINRLAQKEAASK